MINATLPAHHTLRRLAEGKQTYGTYLSPCWGPLLGTAVKMADGSNAVLPWRPRRLKQLDKLVTRKCSSQQAREKARHLFNPTGPACDIDSTPNRMSETAQRELRKSSLSRLHQDGEYWSV